MFHYPFGLEPFVQFIVTVCPAILLIFFDSMGQNSEEMELFDTTGQKSFAFT